MSPLETAESRLAALGLTLPEAPQPFGVYVPAQRSENLLFLSGLLATTGHSVLTPGVVGQQLDVADGRAAARTATLNALALLKRELGSLERVGQVVRLGVHVAATPGFTAHPQVADAASELLGDVLGHAGRSARLVLGAASLPFGSPVELELIVEVKP